MDWALYFYYGLAIVVIIKFIHKVLAGRDQGQPTSYEAGALGRISDRRKFGLSLALIICVASLIPIAYFVLPAVTASTRNQADVEAVRRNISAYENPGVNIVYGEILYPYYESGRLKFDFLTPKGAASYTILRPPDLKVELGGGEHAFIALRGDNQENSQVESIYLWQDANSVLIWKYQP
jgi:hypothetical protein